MTCCGNDINQTFDCLDSCPSEVFSAALFFLSFVRGSPRAFELRFMALHVPFYYVEPSCPGIARKDELYLHSGSMESLVELLLIAKENISQASNRKWSSPKKGRST